MSLHKRIPYLALGLVASAAILSAARSLPKTPHASTPFVPQAPPQRAQGDFDGDGRIDAAIIQDTLADRRISVQLSGSPSAVRLEASVSGVIQGDIDHDGDLDLVAATPSGEVLVWLNDGHGRFTRQPSAGARGFSSEPILSQTVWPEAMALSIGAPLLPSTTRGETIVLATHLHAPMASVPLDVRGPVLPALRAPPARFL